MRIVRHGTPRRDARPTLEMDAQKLILRFAADEGLYCSATPFKSQSGVRRCLKEYYGDKDILLALTSTLDGRVRVASDIMHLRRQGETDIRLSWARDTDRFTKLLRGQLEIYVHMLYVFCYDSKML